MSTSLKERITKKEARVGVIGLGYVGLPLAVEFAKAGFRVTGIDIDQDRVDAINRGENYIGDVDDEQLARWVSSEFLKATEDYSIVSELDAVSICVPTPLSKLKDPDVSFIQSALDVLRLLQDRGAVVDYHDPLVEKIEWDGEMKMGVCGL